MTPVLGRARSHSEQGLFVDGREEARHIELQGPGRAPAVHRHPTEEDHEPNAGRHGAFPLAAGVGVVDEPGFVDVGHGRIVVASSWKHRYAFVGST